jgi:hypothetical protein
LGDRCEKCHNARDWKIWEFDHDRRTDYKLEGGHRRVECEACHTAPAPKGKDIGAISKTCVSCHRRDDAHDGAFGALCERCHVVTNWREVQIRRGGLDRSRLSDLSDSSDRLPRIDSVRVLGDASYFARRVAEPREGLE